MGRCFIVLSNHRSGSSTVAGVMHHLGVNMGGPGHVTPGNPRGHYEDVELLAMHQEMLGETRKGQVVAPLAWADTAATIPPPDLSAYKAALATRAARSEYWGVKDPRLCRLLPLLLDVYMLYDPVVIHVRRSLDESVASIAARTAVEGVRLDPIKTICDYEACKIRTLQAVRAAGVPVRSVDYTARNVAIPRIFAMQIRVAAQLVTGEAALRAAAEFIDPFLKHENF